MTTQAASLMRFKILDGWRAHVCVALIAFVAQTIGVQTIQLWSVKTTVLPMVWALLFSLVFAYAASRKILGFAIDDHAKRLAPAFVQIVLLGFLTKLGLLIGPALPSIKSMGWALLFQEFGHFFGTIMLALPLALILGLKREAIGATFSVGREPNIAIIADRYGLDSPEGRGIIGEYLTGSTVGAPFMALFAAIIVSFAIFDPISLAMGAGVGSASMLAAITASINANLEPEMANKVLAVAAASNLITTVLGTYFTLFVSLPIAVWLYARLEPLIGRTLPSAQYASGKTFKLDHNPKIHFGAKVVALASSAIITLTVGNWIGFGVDPRDAFAGIAIICVITLLSERISVAVPFKVPSVCIASILGMLATTPIHPWATEISTLTGKINPLAFATPALAYVGLAVADELGALKYLGWRIIVVSLTSAVGSFIGAALIASFFRH